MVAETVQFPEMVFYTRPLLGGGDKRPFLKIEQFIPHIIAPAVGGIENITRPFKKLIFRSAQSIF